MKKRALSILTAAAMLLTLLPTASLAEGDINSDSPVCDAEGADLLTVRDPTEPHPEPTIRAVTGWTWVGEDDILSGNTLTATSQGVDTPAWEWVKSWLPTQITAMVAEGYAPAAPGEYPAVTTLADDAYTLGAEVVPLALPVELAAPEGDGVNLLVGDSVTAGAFTMTSDSSLTSGTDYTYESNTLTIKTGKPITLSGTTTTDHIVVDGSCTGDNAANITLNGVDIRFNDYDSWGDICAFEVVVGAECNLTLANGSTNMLQSGPLMAGLQVQSRSGQTATLTITDSGSGGLIATGGRYAAGIGGGSEGTGGSITITGGEVTAQGSAFGAGIGSGYQGDGGDIAISGGTVTATGGDYSAGIGGGSGHSGTGGDGGNITITGGTVKAAGGHVNEFGGSAGIGGGYFGDGGNTTITGGEVTATGGTGSSGSGGAGIGGGGRGDGGEVTITGGAVTANGGGDGAGIGGGNEGASGSFSTGGNSGTGNALIVTSSIQDLTHQNSWVGVIFEGGSNGKIYGSPVSLAGDVKIPADQTLKIETGEILIISKGATLRNGGTIINDGFLVNSGVLDNDVGIPTNNGIFITAPSGGVGVIEGGELLLPGGSNITKGETSVTIEAGTTGIVDQTGGVILPDGGSVSVTMGTTTTTVTLPAGGGKVEITNDDKLTVPGGATVQVGGNDPVTIPEGGGTMDPATGDVTAVAITTPLYFGNGTENVSGIGYSWVKDTKTLTLSGIRLSTADAGGALTIEAGCTVEVEAGTVNEITNTADGIGILVTGSAENAADFLGAGSLAVHSRGDGIVATGDCQIDIGGSVDLAVNAGENGIYSLLDRVCIKDTAKVTVRAEAGNGITCAFGGDSLSPATIPFAMSGAPTVEIYAGADGIQAIDGVIITGGALTASAAGNGIYSDYDAAFENCVLRFPETGTGNGFVGEGDAAFRNVTVTAACGGTALSANGTISMTNCAAELSSSGSGYALFADGLKMDGGTMTAGGVGGGISVEYAASELKNAIVTVDARRGLSAKDLSLINTELCIGTTGQASIGAGQGWTLDGQSALKNSGYLENAGSLTGAGALTNNGVYYHRADAALGLTGMLTSGGGARVICPQEADANRFDGLGTVSRYLTEARDYTRLPAPQDEGGFAWDAQANVLTLSGVCLEADGAFALKVPDGTAICLVGAPSTISNTDDQGVGIQMEGVVSLTGECGLSVSANIPIQSAEYLTVYDTALQTEGNAGIVGQTLEVGNTALSIRSVDIPCLYATQRVKLMGCALDLMSLNGSAVEVLEMENTEPTQQLTVSPLLEGYSAGAQAGVVTLLNGEGEAAQIMSTENRVACIKVYFNSQGGTPCPIQVAAKGDMLQLPIPERQGYVFLGWFTADGTKLAGGNAAFTGDTVLYAMWQTMLTLSTDPVSTPPALTFGTSTTGYSQPTARTVTVTNTGDRTLTLIQPAATNYVVGPLSHTELTVGATATFTVQPKVGLTQGVYDETILLSGSYDANAALTASFTVVALSGGGSTSHWPSAKVDGTGGTVKTSSGTVTITPDEGYQIAKITVNGKEVDIPENCKLTGLKRTDKVVVSFEKIPDGPPTVDMSKYTDLNAGSWYFEAVRYVVEHGLFQGTSGTMFSPNVTMTRAMFFTVLARMDGQDTTGGETWYSRAMDWAKSAGVSDCANPDGSLTREQLATMLWRYAGSPETTGTLDGFTDADEAGSYATDALRWAVERGIITGKGGGILDPKGEATRAEVAAMLMRYLMTN